MDAEVRLKQIKDSVERGCFATEVFKRDWQFVIEQAEKAYRYEEALKALLGISMEYEQDENTDIITDTLWGHGLLDRYKEYLSDGENISIN